MSVILSTSSNVFPTWSTAFTYLLPFVTVVDSFIVSEIYAAIPGILRIGIKKN